MVNTDLLWLILLPLALSTISFWLLPKLDCDIVLQWSAMLSVGGFVISAVIISTAFFIGKGSRTMDTEVWNGTITQKERIQGTYEEAYSCHCRQSCSGSGKNRSCQEVCDTCYRTHYTVTWKANSTLGTFQIDHEDSTSRLVYMTPDPGLYTRTTLGEPCAETHGYTNYIKAVPESLFRPSSESMRLQFAKMIPSYPQSFYGIWRLDRVIPVGVKVPNVADWNRKLADVLRELGPKKQANAIIVLVNTTNPDYAFALRDAWIGGKKNDIVVIIGVTQFPQKADWVRVLAMTDNEMFRVKLRDDLMALDTLTPDNVVNALRTDTLALFKRKPMKDFEYLDSEIDPPLWVNVTTAIVDLLAYVGFWVFVYRNRSSSALGRAPARPLWR
jgi:hypothetical protein